MSDRPEPLTPTLPSAERADGGDLRLISRLAKLYVAVVSDCLDAVGLRENTMASHIRPILPNRVLAGYAATVELVEVETPPADPSDYYRGEIEAVDALQPGDVIVVSTCDGGFWGELLATACRARGANGVVADAYTRDTRALRQMDFLAHVAGIDPRDSLGRTDVRTWGVTVSCGGVRVERGDLVIADDDGAAVIPAALGVDVIERAEDKVAREHAMRGQLAAGTPMGEAFRIHGIL